jgi:hypothetical protein
MPVLVLYVKHVFSSWKSTKSIIKAVFFREAKDVLI